MPTEVQNLGQIVYQQESEAQRKYSQMKHGNINADNFSAQLKAEISNIFVAKINRSPTISDYSKVGNWYLNYKDSLGEPFRKSCYIYFLKNIKAMANRLNEFQIQQSEFRDRIEEIKTLGINIFSLIQSPEGIVVFPQRCDRLKISNKLK